MRRPRVRFTLAGAMWAVLVVALILGAFRLETPLGVWAYAISSVALVRILRVAVRLGHEGRALGAVGLAGLVAGSVLAAATLVTASASAFVAVTIVLGPYMQGPATLDLLRLVAGLLAGGIVARLLVPITWRYPAWAFPSGPR